MISLLKNNIAMKPFITTLINMIFCTTISAQVVNEISGTKLLTTSIRTGDTEVFIVDPLTADAFNVSKAPKSEERYHYGCQMASKLFLLPTGKTAKHLIYTSLIRMAQ